MKKTKSHMKETEKHHDGKKEKARHNDEKEDMKLIRKKVKKGCIK